MSPDPANPAAPPDNRFRRRDKNRPLRAPTGQASVFQLRKNIVRWIEIEDVLFHFDSAVLMPDAEAEDEPGTPDEERISGLSVIRAAYMQAADNPKQKLLIAGHTDTAGAASYNEDLSKLRARDVVHVVLGEKDPWVKIAQDHGKNEDVKHILRWVARWKGWPCHTDSTGNVCDQSMTDATKGFQQSFSDDPEFHPIGVDGSVGKETWGAFFELYMARLAELAQTDVAGLAALRGKVNWLYGDKKSLGCGEYHPIDMPGKDGFKSQINRRVELLFYDPEEEPLEKPSGSLCHAGGVGGASTCLIYNPLLYEYEHLVPKRLHLTTVDDHFAPGAETLDIAYQIEGLGGSEVTLEISSPHYDSNPIFKRKLSAGETADGAHTIGWDGRANAAAGTLKGALIHPLFSPYEVRLFDSGAHSDSAKFKVMYQDVKLRRGPWTADEKEPPESDEKAWVAFKLNEFGYFGGPVGKDTDDYLDKAVVRYKANHKAMHELDVRKYKHDITDTLKKALKAGDNKRVFLEGDPFGAPDKETRLYLEALTYEAKTEFTKNRHRLEKARLNRPLLPIEAEITLRGKNDSPMSSPGAVGPVRVNWRFRDADEDLATLPADLPKEPSKTQAYLKKALELKGGRVAPDGDNCHKDFGGLRDTPDTTWKTPVFVGDAYVPHIVEEDAGQKVVFSKACVDGAKFPKRVGRAGVYFRPSFIGGDDYRITAELDFTGLPNQAELESLHGITADVDTRPHAQSGVIRIWRAARVAVRITWPARRNDPEWGKIAAEFQHAWLKMDTSTMVTKKIGDVLTEGQYKKMVADKTDHKKSDVSLLDDALVGVKLPKQGRLNASDYQDALKSFTDDNYWDKIVYAMQEQLSQNIRKEHPTGFIVAEFLTHRPIKLQKAPPGDKTVLDPAYVTWSFSIGLPDSTIFADQRDPDKVYYVVSHEMGHNFWLQHWEHSSGVAADHDTLDHNCLLSYSSNTCAHAHHRQGKYTPHFCGQCNLKLRGWNIDSPLLPGSSA